VILYALFPAIAPAMLSAKWRSLIILAVTASIGGAQLSRLLEGFSYLFPASAQSEAGIYFSLWLPRQLPCFIFGIMLFKFSAERPSIPKSIAKPACVLAVALMLFIPFLEGVKYALPLGLSTTYGISFSLFAFSLMYWRKSPLINAPVGWIGKVSYSAYFVHFAVLNYLSALHRKGSALAEFAMMYGVVLAATVTISSIIYLTIEKPMINVGSQINRRTAFEGD
jgi:peptidoglycan/LPS O-acetylase OafA/YrhL